MATRFTLLLASVLLSSLAVACGGDDDGGVPAVDAAIDPRCIVDDGEPIPFACPCNLADDQCDTANGDMCFSFNEKGPHCTHACDDAADCPAPSGDCNNMGVCKAPE